jgi:hypothetical protein
VVNQFMRPGDYQVLMLGYAGPAPTYSYDELNPTRLTVKAFEQKTASDTPTSVVLSKQQ